MDVLAVWPLIRHFVVVLSSLPAPSLRRRSHSLPALVLLLLFSQSPLGIGFGEEFRPLVREHEHRLLVLVLCSLRVQQPRLGIQLPDVLSYGGGGRLRLPGRRVPVGVGEEHGSRYLVLVMEVGWRRGSEQVGAVVVVMAEMDVDMVVMAGVKV